MDISQDILYTQEHIWVKKEGDRARIGFTQYAHSEIGDILLVELPEIGKQAKKGEKLAVIETAKAIFDLKAPISARVVEVNSTLGKKPELIKDDPYRDGWMIVLETDPSETWDHLMDFEEYEAYIKEEGAV